MTILDPVMAGLDPAIHILRVDRMDGRLEAGHDKEERDVGLTLDAQERA